jgi:hypothetical protein
VPRKHEISTELRFNHTQDTDSTLIWRQPLTLAGAPSGNPFEGENDNTHSRTSQLTGQLDYTKVFATGTKLDPDSRVTAAGSTATTSFSRIRRAAAPGRRAI